MNTTKGHVLPAPAEQIGLVLLGTSAALIPSIAAVLRLEVALAIVLLGLWFIYFSARSLRLWLSTALFLHIILFLERTETVTANEAIFAVYFYGLLGHWIIKRYLSGSFDGRLRASDQWLMLFGAIVVGSFGIAAFSGSSLSLWFRESLVFTGFLLFLPLKEGFKDATTKRLVLGAFLLLSVVLAIRNMWNYRSGLAAAEYVWQVLSSRQASNAPFFMVIILYSISVWMVSRRLVMQVVSIISASFFTVALILTFTRGYWLATVLGIGIIWLLGNSAERRRIMVLAALATIVPLVILMLLFSDVSSQFFAMLTMRVSSYTSATSDISFANRIVETSAIWEQIIRNPFAGYGMGATFSYNNLMSKSTFLTAYAHNAYLYLWYKIGLFGLLTFMAGYMLKIWEGFRAYQQHATESERPESVTALALLLIMLPVSITSPQFYARDSILIISLCWAQLGMLGDRSTSSQVDSCCVPVHGVAN